MHVMHDNNGKQYPKDIYNKSKRALYLELIKDKSYDKYVLGLKHDKIKFVLSTMPTGSKYHHSLNGAGRKSRGPGGVLESMEKTIYKDAKKVAMATPAGQMANAVGSMLKK